MGKKRNATPKGAIVTNVLRDAISDSGLTLTRIAELAKVPVPSLSLFMRGKRSLSLPVAEKLMGVLGVKVIAPPKAAKS
jgi:plasmid maintenance system antidote protein VapI